MRGTQGELAGVGDGSVQPRHHGIEDVRQPVQFIAAAGQGQPLLEVVELDGFCGPGERCDRRERFPQQQGSSDQQQDGGRQAEHQDDFSHLMPGCFGSLASLEHPFLLLLPFVVENGRQHHERNSQDAAEPKREPAADAHGWDFST